MFKSKIKTKIKIPTNLRFIIFGLSLFSILAYLVVVNGTNTKGIEMGQMQYTIKELRDKSRDLDNQVTELQSMQRVKEISNEVLSMVESGTYDYILPNSGAVAVNE